MLANNSVDSRIYSKKESDWPQSCWCSMWVGLCSLTCFTVESHLNSVLSEKCLLTHRWRSSWHVRTHTHTSLHILHIGTGNIPSHACQNLQTCTDLQLLLLLLFLSSSLDLRLFVLISFIMFIHLFSTYLSTWGRVTPHRKTNFDTHVQSTQSSQLTSHACFKGLENLRRTQ